MSHSCWSETRRKRWEKRLALGLCVYCGKKQDGEQIACSRCREKKNAILRKSNLNLKLAAFDAYGGRRCSCKKCPERKEPRIEFLTLNHIGGGGTKHRASLGGKRIPGGGFTLGGVETYRWLRKNKYPPGFNVLCWNCQWGVHINKGKCPHEEKV